MGKKHTKKIIITAAVAAVLTGLIVCTAPFIIPAFNSQQITLEQGFYNESKAIDIDKSGYEQLIADKKSFILMVDNQGCKTTSNMRQMMSEFDLKFTYYRIYWPDTKDTNIRNKIKYFPSVTIVKNGEIVAALQADSDEDAKYYNNASDLQDWIKSHVKFPN